MKPKLKENPKDWLKFTVVCCIVGMLIVRALERRGILRRELALALFALALSTLVLCMVRPTWFRGFYRAGMTVSFYVGEVVSRALLTVLFLLVVTPLGLLLRVFGKDLLQLKRKPPAQSYWHSVNRPENLDRQGPPAGALALVAAARVVSRCAAR